MTKKRTCNLCNKQLNLTEFDLVSSKSGHLRKQCKSCIAVKNITYYRNKMKEIKDKKEKDKQEVDEMNSKIFEEVFGEKL